jgi:hypothetical protein
MFDVKCVWGRHTIDSHLVVKINILLPASYAPTTIFTYVSMKQCIFCSKPKAILCSTHFASPQQLFVAYIPFNQYQFVLQWLATNHAIMLVSFVEPWLLILANFCVNHLVLHFVFLLMFLLHRHFVEPESSHTLFISTHWQRLLQWLWLCWWQDEVVFDSLFDNE